MLKLKQQLSPAPSEKKKENPIKITFWQQRPNVYQILISGARYATLTTCALQMLLVVFS
jgi:hypothetical protein